MIAESDICRLMQTQFIAYVCTPDYVFRVLVRMI